MKFSPSILQHISRDLIRDATPGSLFHKSVFSRGKKIDEKVMFRWVQHLMDRNSIANRMQTGKLMTSPDTKGFFIEKSIPFHMGMLKSGFEVFVKTK